MYKSKSIQQVTCGSVLLVNVELTTTWH